MPACSSKRSTYSAPMCLKNRCGMNCCLNSRLATKANVLGSVAYQPVRPEPLGNMPDELLRDPMVARQDGRRSAVRMPEVDSLEFEVAPDDDAGRTFALIGGDELQGLKKRARAIPDVLDGPRIGGELRSFV